MPARHRPLPRPWPPTAGASRLAHSAAERDNRSRSATARRRTRTARSRRRSWCRRVPRGTRRPPGPRPERPAAGRRRRPGQRAQRSPLSTTTHSATRTATLRAYARRRRRGRSDRRVTLTRSAKVAATAWKPCGYGRSARPVPSAAGARADRHDARSAQHLEHAEVRDVVVSPEQHVERALVRSPGTPTSRSSASAGNDAGGQRHRRRQHRGRGHQRAERARRRAVANHADERPHDGRASTRPVVDADRPPEPP